MNLVNKISYHIIELIDKHIHRKKIIALLNQILVKPKYILDIGAHKGSYTDQFLNFNKSANITLFEPNIYLYEQLLIKYKKKKKFENFKSWSWGKDIKEKILT